MKLIHTADLHLDSNLETSLTGEAASLRKAELLKSFSRLVDYAKNNEIKAVIIAGDLFDTEGTFQKRAKQQVFTVIKEAFDITFLYKKGNHDKDSSFEENAKELPNFHLLSENSTEGFFLDDGKICVSGNKAFDFSEKTFNILCLHGDTNSEINLKSLSKKIDYLALGHIHKFSEGELPGGGKWCYPGCLEGRGFDECGKKGFVELEINEKNSKSTFVPFSFRTVHKVKCCFDGLVSFSSCIEKIREALKKIPSKDLVEVYLTGEVLEESVIDERGITEMFEDGFFVFRLKNKLKYKIDYTKYEKDISLKGEFVRTVLKMDITEDEKSQVLLTGLRLFSGREVKFL